MAMQFYPYEEDMQKGNMEERLRTLLESAERFRAAVIDTVMTEETQRHAVIPRDILFSFNWNEIAVVLREVRTLSEGSKVEQVRKARLLFKLSEIYEVLRAAKMPKLEAVRLALISESTQLGGGTTAASTQ